MRTIKINLGKRSYKVIIGFNIASKLGALLSKLNFGRDAVIITNPQVKRFVGNKIIYSLRKYGFSHKFFIVPDSERSKSIQVAFSLFNRLVAYDNKKSLFIIALGGGVVGDLAGFIASVYRRGIPYIQIPTTLLSQIDSSIGGKVGIDLPMGKNLVGAFYQPKLVICDISFLSSLGRIQLISGLAEAIKYGIISETKLFGFISDKLDSLLCLKRKELEWLIYRCCLIKSKIVEQDEREEKKIRTLLNYGHTIGHAIEAASGYKLYNHGQAIAIGMICEARLANMLGILEYEQLLSIEELIFKAGLPIKISRLKLKDILQAMSHDKKFLAKRNRFVLPLRIGYTKVFDNIPEAKIKNAIKSLMH